MELRSKAKLQIFCCLLMFLTVKFLYLLLSYLFSVQLWLQRETARKGCSGFSILVTIYPVASVIKTLANLNGHWVKSYSMEIHHSISTAHNYCSPYTSDKYCFFSAIVSSGELDLDYVKPLLIWGHCVRSSGLPIICFCLNLGTLTIITM